MNIVIPSGEKRNEPLNVRSIKQLGNQRRNGPLNVKSIKQSQKRNGLLKGKGIGRVLNLIVWQIECDTGRLNIHWNAIKRVLTNKVTQRYVVYVHVLVATVPTVTIDIMLLLHDV